MSESPGLLFNMTLLSGRKRMLTIKETSNFIADINANFKNKFDLLEKTLRRVCFGVKSRLFQNEVFNDGGLFSKDLFCPG